MSFVSAVGIGKTTRWQNREDMITTHYFSGSTAIDFNAKAGDQIWLHGKGTVTDDAFDSIPTLAMRVEGDIVDTSYDNFSVIGGGVSSSLNVFYVYNVPEDMEINIELTSGEYGLEESEIDYIHISNQGDQMIVDSIGIIGGIITFLAMFGIIIFYFKRK